MLPARDRELLQIVDRNWADAARRAHKPGGGSWLSCQPGCTSCCHGVFRISMLDRERLRAALAELSTRDPHRAQSIRSQARDAVLALAPTFPGDPHTGLLGPEDDPAWERFADAEDNDLPCPVLDPRTGQCALYNGRPLTCRIFGPPVQTAEGIGMCELCYTGASEQQILAGEMRLDHEELAAELGDALGQAQPDGGETIIAWALLAPE